VVRYCCTLRDTIVRIRRTACCSRSHRMVRRNVET
jgi:hypothetical protein